MEEGHSMEVLVEQNINGKTDTSYIYGADTGCVTGRLSLDRLDGSSGYYLYDPRGSVTGITNEEGQLYQSYRYNAYGEITFGAPQYENEYTYNGESYNPNIESQYLRARYYYVVTASFLTEDSYLGDISEPLTLNRYLYCVASPLNYTDSSGHSPLKQNSTAGVADISYPSNKQNRALMPLHYYGALQELGISAMVESVPNYNYEQDASYAQGMIEVAGMKSNTIICDVDQKLARGGGRFIIHGESCHIQE